MSDKELCRLTMSEDKNGQILNIDSDLDKDCLLEILEMAITLVSGNYEKHRHVKH